MKNSGKHSSAVVRVCHVEGRGGDRKWVIVEASQKMVSILGSLMEGSSEVRAIIDPTTAESATR